MILVPHLQSYYTLLSRLSLLLSELETLLRDILGRLGSTKPGTASTSAPQKNASE
jgi:hypothetical protein